MPKFFFERLELRVFMHAGHAHGDSLAIARAMGPATMYEAPLAAALSASSITWTTRAQAPIARAEALKAVVKTRLYVFGGFSNELGPVTRSDVYDPASNTWTKVTDMPTRLTHSGVAVVGTDVYFAGGYVGIGSSGYNQTFGVRDVRKFSTTTKTWSTLPQLPVALAGGGLVALGRTLHYFSGNNSSRNDVGNHYELNLDNTAAGWITRAALPDPRSHFGYATRGRFIFAIGGQHGNDDGLTTVQSVHRYDPLSNSWAKRADVPIAVSHIASATFVHNGKIIVAGGEIAHETPTARVYSYDTEANKWSSLGYLPAARFSGVGAAIGEIIYFTGGSSQRTTWRGVLS